MAVVVLSVVAADLVKFISSVLVVTGVVRIVLLVWWLCCQPLLLEWLE